MSDLFFQDTPFGLPLKVETVGVSGNGVVTPGYRSAVERLRDATSTTLDRLEGALQDLGNSPNQTVTDEDLGVELMIPVSSERGTIIAVLTGVACGTSVPRSISILDQCRVPLNLNPLFVQVTEWLSQLGCSVIVERSCVRPLGVVGARQMLFDFRRSDSKLIWHLDEDCVPTWNCLSTLLRPFSSNGPVPLGAVCGVCCQVGDFRGLGKDIGLRPSESKDSWSRMASFEREAFCQSVTRFQLGNVLIAEKALDGIGGFSAAITESVGYGEDILISSLMKAAGWELLLVNALAIHLWGPARWDDWVYAGNAANIGKIVRTYIREGRVDNVQNS